MPKQKQYDYDFEQDINHQLPTVRNLSEQKVWNQPNWTGITKPSTTPVCSNNPRTNRIDESLTKKQYQWEKPNWVVPSSTDNNSSKATTTSSGRTTIEKESIIKPNQHPILKTSKQTQIENEMQQLQKQLDEAKALKEKLLKEQQQQAAATAAAAASKTASTTKSNSAKGTVNDATGTDTSVPITETDKEAEKHRQQIEQLEALRLSVKEKEEIAWKNREKERRESERQRREEAKKKHY